MVMRDLLVHSFLASAAFGLYNVKTGVHCPLLAQRFRSQGFY